MKLNLKSHAKINLALNVTGKNKSLHKIESIISFINLYDVISIKKIRAEKHNIFFQGKFAKGIGKKNTVQKLFQIPFLILFRFLFLSFPSFLFPSISVITA